MKPTNRAEIMSFIYELQEGFWREEEGGPARPLPLTPRYNSSDNIGAVLSFRSAHETFDTFVRGGFKLSANAISICSI